MTKGGVVARPPAGDGPAPRAAEDLGLGDRYRYLVGASGRRYLFTRVSFDRLEECPGAVVALERPEAADAQAERIVWLGEIDRDGRRRGPPLPRGARKSLIVLVHLLAGDAAGRRVVLDDLG
ncbi:MAG: hypothetical protein CMN87_09120 [Stappia sp.]|nr:hypothetical protein [Stappia sp.]MBM20158.1 hypothetical protein [Stappia sp.]